MRNTIFPRSRAALRGAGILLVFLTGAVLLPCSAPAQDCPPVAGYTQNCGPGGCPYCVREIYTPHAPPVLSVSMRWSGITEAPTVSDPGLACFSNDFKTMLWRRHERATDCVWIDQAAITLRSGGTIQKSDFVKLDDLVTSTGLPGDIQITPNIDEAVDTWLACDAAWSPQDKGMLPVSAGWLVNASGAPVARGLAMVGSACFPWLLVSDPDGDSRARLCQINERSLAHEAGHVLGLGHRQVGCNLMFSGGVGATLDADHIQDARDYVMNTPSLDPRLPVPLIASAGGRLGAPAVDRVGAVFDGRDAGHQFDVLKAMAFDNFTTTGSVTLAMGLAAPIVDDFKGEARYYFGLDTDAADSTGSNTSDIVAEWSMEGIELLLEIRRQPFGGGLSFTLYTPGEFGSLVPFLIPEEEITLGIVTVNGAVCDPTPEYAGALLLPALGELTAVMSQNAVELLGLPAGPRFPSGLRMQCVTHVGAIIDFGPDQPGVMELPAIVFPQLTVPEEASPGDSIDVEVSGMPPNAALHMFFGEFEFHPGAMSDGNGDAAFSYAIPAAAPTGRTLVTVGIEDPNNAMTADGSVLVRSDPTDVEPGLPSTPWPLQVTVIDNPGRAPAGLIVHTAEVAEVTLRIFDPEGRLVRRLHDGTLGAGRHRMFWDGTNDQGQPVTSGVYWVHVTAGPHVDTERITLVH